MPKGRQFSHNLLWIFMAVVIGGVITIDVLTNTTLRSIEKRLPNTLLSELNDLSSVLEVLVAVVATEITGYSKKDIKTSEDWLSRACPDSECREKVIEDWNCSKDQKKAIREFKVTCSNNEVKDIEFRGSYLPDGRALSTLADITDRKRAEKMLRESRRIKVRAKKMESLGLLAGGVAHDLNNIFSGIVSYPELLLLDLPKDSNLRKPIQVMQESGKRAAAIVLDLLTVARGVATTKEPINLNHRIHDYLRENDVDLIILDMIINPGINGRETYERILKIEPKQKALIASGFAETNEVKRTQKLGAGKFIRKPLTIEYFGIAVKEELERE